MSIRGVCCLKKLFSEPFCKVDNSSISYLLSRSYRFYELALFLFLRFYLFIYREEEGREKEMERNMDEQEIHWSVASCMPPTGDLACNPGMCPDREFNRWPLVHGPAFNSRSYSSQGQLALSVSHLLVILNFAKFWERKWSWSSGPIYQPVVQMASKICTQKSEDRREGQLWEMRRCAAWDVLSAGFPMDQQITP